MANGETTYKLILNVGENATKTIQLNEVVFSDVNKDKYNYLSRTFSNGSTNEIVSLNRDINACTAIISALLSNTDLVLQLNSLSSRGTDLIYTAPILMQTTIQGTTIELIKYDIKLVQTLNIENPVTSDGVGADIEKGSRKFKLWLNKNAPVFDKII